MFQINPFIIEEYFFLKIFLNHCINKKFEFKKPFIS